MAFLLKTSRACTDMLSYENDAIIFSKTAKITKQHVHHVHSSSGARETGIFSPTQSAVDQKHECKSSRRGVLISALGKTWNGMEWIGLEWNGME